MTSNYKYEKHHIIGTARKSALVIDIGYVIKMTLDLIVFLLSHVKLNF